MAVEHQLILEVFGAWLWFAVVLVGAVALVAALLWYLVSAASLRRKLRTNMLAHDLEMDIEKVDQDDPLAPYGEYPPDPMFRPMGREAERP